MAPCSVLCACESWLALPSRPKTLRLSDLSLDPRGRPLMAMTIPVENLGAIVMDIDPARFLYPYLRVWPGSSKTAETLLMRRDGVDGVLYLSELRR